MQRGQLALVVIVGLDACGTTDEPPVMREPEMAVLLRSASEMTLFAIEPHGAPPGEALHGYAIRKAVTIPRGDMQRVATAVALGLGYGPSANCFEPHHALRVTSGGQTVDLVMCFTCSAVEVYRGEQVIRRIPTAFLAERVLAVYLGPTPVDSF